jgi:hypothetical protein
MHVWFDFALAKLIALAHKVGFKLASIHRNCLSQVWNNSTPRCTMRPTDPRSRAAGELSISWSVMMRASSRRIRCGRAPLRRVPRVADAEPHGVRPVWIEVIGAVAHAATIMPCRRQRQNRAALTPKPRRPQAARMPQAQNAR